MGLFSKFRKSKKESSVRPQLASTTSSSGYSAHDDFGCNPSPPTRRPGQHNPPVIILSDPDGRDHVVDAPPSYSEATKPAALSVPAARLGSNVRNASPTPSAASAITVESVTRAEDPYAFLTSFDTVFVIDDSYSMKGSNWKEVRALLESITPICADHDSDGVDVYFLNYKSSQAPLPKQGKPGLGFRNINSHRRLSSIFEQVQPSLATPIGQTLQRILKPYTAYYTEQARKAELRGDYEIDVKPMNIIVITDGAATDEVESVIVNHAKKLDKADAPAYQVGIQFFQVGKDSRARDFLRGLDDDLAENGVRDMVDTMSWEGRGSRSLSADGILKTVLGAVVKRLDRRRLSEESRRPNMGPRGRF
ncbi:uncharacterized protein MKZ38_008249 [Zalerion maritima]|uniref:VWFA domain-containing protein n=1 Tax=Zalerion maritima TaxID=339359 RepID=A0AAD5RU88_9PEZI|nr:uncharacterized protein MKZ38_008249 [Zalerion maritima]